ncbi:MAG: type I phosphomannose isomerase catalytic subunit [Actinomycetota bacterium]
MGRVSLYPLKFQPLIRDYYFGGRRLAEMFARPLPDGVVAETWELSDHPSNPAVVDNGALAGRTLSDLIGEWGEDLVGSRILAAFGNRLPLLLKFLDVHQLVAAQVHPDDAYAQARGLDEMGKTEAWHVVYAEPGASVFRGMRSRATRSDLEAAADAGDLTGVLQPVVVEAGDTVFVPAGCVHAIGAGMVLFEIQQNSDVTLTPWCLFQNGQVIESTLAGAGREMFMEQVTFESSPAEEAKVSPVVLAEDGGERRFLVACRQFELESWSVRDVWEEPAHPDMFVALTPLNGEGVIEYGAGGEETYEAGRTLMIPAGIGDYRLRPRTESVVLRSCVADLDRDVVRPLREAGIVSAAIAQLGAVTGA